LYSRRSSAEAIPAAVSKALALKDGDLVTEGRDRNILDPIADRQQPQP
jgi:hypothetical protein